MLLIVSHPGEGLGREDFSSVIWKLELHQLIKIKDWEEDVRSSLLESILRYDPRLRDVSLEVRLAEIDEGNADKCTVLQPHTTHLHKEGKVTSTGHSSDQYWSQREVVVVDICYQYWSLRRPVLVCIPL